MSREMKRFHMAEADRRGCYERRPGRWVRPANAGHPGNIGRI